MMGMRVDTTYNVHGLPWNINPENMNLLLKRLNGSRMLGGSYTPNAKGSFVQRYCITALRLELKLAALGLPNLCHDPGEAKWYWQNLAKLWSAE